MKRLSRWLRMSDVVLHMLLGALIVFCAFPLMSAARREKAVRWWAGVLLQLFGLTVALKGHLSQRERPHMLVLNHVSWIDVYVVDRYRASCFVAKSEIRAWPLVGWLCERTGTIFIERGKRRAVHGAIESIKGALRAGACVAVFPEGTTSDGSVLLPFHSNLLQAAIDTATPILPATIRYLDQSGKLAVSAAFVGDMTMWESAFRLLAAAPLIAELTLLRPIASDMDRRELANEARGQMVLALGLNTGNEEFALAGRAISTFGGRS